MRESERWSKLIANLTSERDAAVRDRELCRQALVLVERLTDGAGMSSAEIESETYELIEALHGLASETLSLTTTGGSSEP